jgi:hypothetical protein
MMRYRAASQTQRTRYQLNQQAIQRSQRRCNLVRIMPESDAIAPQPDPAHETEQPNKSVSD